MRTFTKDTALSEQGRGAAWHVWIKARHGRGTAWARHVMCESAFRADPNPPQKSVGTSDLATVRKIYCRHRLKCVSILFTEWVHYTGDTKNRKRLKNPTKIEEIQEKKIIDRNWTITTCLLRYSNANYQCLKITYYRWRPPPRMHSFTVTTHFKSSRSFVSPCVCCMLCRMRQSRILQSMQHTQGDTKEEELLKCVVAVKERVRGGGRHLQEVIFKHW